MEDRTYDFKQLLKAFNSKNIKDTVIEVNNRLIAKTDKTCVVIEIANIESVLHLLEALDVVDKARPIQGAVRSEKRRRWHWRGT